MMRRPFRSIAQHLLVRRYGKANDWNCTALEISQTTGVPIHFVRRICRESGYPVQSAYEGGDFLNVMPVDNFIRMGCRDIRSRY